MPGGGTWWYRGGGGGGGGWGSKKFLFQNSARFGVWVTYMNGTCTGNFFLSSPLGLWGGVKILNFWTCTWGISNLRGWAVDQDRLKHFNLWSNWWPWDGVKGSITIRFLQERGDLWWRAIECVLVTFYVYALIHVNALKTMCWAVWSVFAVYPVRS